MRHFKCKWIWVDEKQETKRRVSLLSPSAATANAVAKSEIERFVFLTCYANVNEVI